MLKDAKEYIIDDAELERVYKSYPVMWKDASAKPTLCFIGCPHLTYSQLCGWTDAITGALETAGKTKVAVPTVLTASPAVCQKFKKTEGYAKLTAMGARLSSICPLMYTNNPLTKRRRIITNSNKLRTYSRSRYYLDEKILALITGKEV